VFATLLRIQRQRGDRPCVEAVDADLLVGLFAEAVTPFLDATQRLSIFEISLR